MSYQQIILVGIATLALIGVAWYLTWSDGIGVREQIDQTVDGDQVRNPELLSGNRSLSELMVLADESVQCEFSQTFEAGLLTGTFYSDTERVYVDSEVEDDEGLITGRLIDDRTTVYVWNETNEGIYAFQFSSPSSSQGGTSLEEAGFNGVVAYECRPWGPDEALFVPPENINFQGHEDTFDEFSEELPQLQ